MSIFDEKEISKSESKSTVSDKNRDEFFDFSLFLPIGEIKDKSKFTTDIKSEAIVKDKGGILNRNIDYPMSIPLGKQNTIGLNPYLDNSKPTYGLQYQPNVNSKVNTFPVPFSDFTESNLFYSVNTDLTQSKTQDKSVGISLSDILSTSIASSSAFSSDASIVMSSDMSLSTDSHDYPQQNRQEQKQQIENQLRMEDSFTQRNEFENQFKRNIKNVKKDKRDDEEKKRRRKKISDENGVISYNRYLIYHPEIATPEQFSGFGEVSPIIGKSRYLNTEVLSWGGGSTVKKESKSDKNAKTIMKMMDALNFNVLPVAMSGRKSKVHSISKKGNANKLNKKKLSSKI